MPVENVKSFYAVVTKNEQLRLQLAEIPCKYQTEALDMNKADGLYEQQVFPLAAQLGFPFSMSDLRQYEEDLLNNIGRCGRELSETDLHKISGGRYDGQGYFNINGQ